MSRYVGRYPTNCDRCGELNQKGHRCPPLEHKDNYVVLGASKASVRCRACDKFSIKTPTQRGLVCTRCEHCGHYEPVLLEGFGVWSLTVHHVASDADHPW